MDKRNRGGHGMNHRPVHYKDCKYNTSTTSNFVGYCDHPKHDTPTFHPFIKCKECICDDFELGEDI